MFFSRGCIPSPGMSVHFPDPDLAGACRSCGFPAYFLHQKAKGICGIYERKGSFFFLRTNSGKNGEK